MRLPRRSFRHRRCDARHPGALDRVFGLSEQLLAQGTALIMAFPNVLIALVRYTQKAGLDLRAAALLGGSALPFTYVSALFATSLASRDLRIGFAVFLILIAFDIARRALRPAPPARAVALPWPLVGIVGAVCGVVSGFFDWWRDHRRTGDDDAFGYLQLKAQGDVARVCRVIGSTHDVRVRIQRRRRLDRCDSAGCRRDARGTVRCGPRSPASRAPFAASLRHPGSRSPWASRC